MLSQLWHEVLDGEVSLEHPLCRYNCLALSCFIDGQNLSDGRTKDRLNNHHVEEDLFINCWRNYGLC